MRRYAVRIEQRSNGQSYGPTTWRTDYRLACPDVKAARYMLVDAPTDLNKVFLYHWGENFDPSQSATIDSVVLTFFDIVIRVLPKSHFEPKVAKRW